MGVDAEMVVVAPQVLTDRDLLRLAYETCGGFGTERFFISRDDTYGGPHHALTPGTSYALDPHPEPGYVFTVRLWQSYYGPGYERGDLPFLLGLRRWFESKLPGARVYYGGDSGEALTLLDDDVERELWQHFITHQRFPYITHKRSLLGGDGIDTPHCDLCDEDLLRNGFGANYGGFWCAGCGYEVETRDGGKTWGQRERSRA